MHQELDRLTNMLLRKAINYSLHPSPYLSLSFCVRERACWGGALRQSKQRRTVQLQIRVGSVYTLSVKRHHLSPNEQMCSSARYHRHLRTRCKYRITLQASYSQKQTISKLENENACWTVQTEPCTSVTARYKASGGAEQALPHLQPRHPRGKTSALPKSASGSPDHSPRQEHMDKLTGRTPSTYFFMPINPK